MDGRVLIQARDACRRLAGMLACALACVAAPLHAHESEPLPPPYIAIIIDDLGNQLDRGRRVIALDAPVSCAVMPHTTYATRLSEEAHAAGKEVLLHLPMQAAEDDPHSDPYEITLDDAPEDIRAILSASLESVPHASGVNNHMGSLITRHPSHMHSVLDAIEPHGLFFVDSFTTHLSVGYTLALERGIPSVRRHVFLDNEPAPDAFRYQLERLKRRAGANGYAVAIAHPHPGTLEFLEEALPALEAEGFALVSVRELLDLQARGMLAREAPPVNAALAEARQAVVW